MPLSAGLSPGRHEIELRTVDDETGVSSNIFSDSFVISPAVPPVVSIAATDPEAIEGANIDVTAHTGTFTITRDQTLGDLTVSYTVAGSAAVPGGEQYHHLGRGQGQGEGGDEKEQSVLSILEQLRYAMMD